MNSSTAEPVGSEQWRDRSAFKSDRLRAWLAIPARALVVVMSVVSSTLLLIEHFLLPNWTSEISDSNAAAIGFALALAWAAVAYFVAITLAAVTFLMWLYRAVENARVVGNRRLRTTPAMAVLCWFVPFLNLVRPYQVVKSLYRASEPSNSTVNSNLPGDWIQRLPTILPLWWAIWIIQTLLGNASTRVTFSDAANAREALMWLDVIALPFCIVAAVLAAAVLWSIHVRQAARALEPDTAFRVIDEEAADEY